MNTDKGIKIVLGHLHGCLCKLSRTCSGFWGTSSFLGRRASFSALSEMNPPTSQSQRIPIEIALGTSSSSPKNLGASICSFFFQQLNNMYFCYLSHLFWLFILCFNFDLCPMSLRNIFFNYFPCSLYWLSLCKIMVSGSFLAFGIAEYLDQLQWGDSAFCTAACEDFSQAFAWLMSIGLFSRQIHAGFCPRATEWALQGI